MISRKKIAFSIALALALGSIGYGLLGPSGGKQDQLQAELNRLLEENQALRSENLRLALEVEALKRRRDYLEKAARDELGLIKSDEVIIQLFEPSARGREDAEP